MGQTRLDEPFLNLGEAAEIIRVTPEYLRQQLRLGRLAGYRIGREWRVSREQLDAWLTMLESRSRVS